jgi:hypothetical protein
VIHGFLKISPEVQTLDGETQVGNLCTVLNQLEELVWHLVRGNHQDFVICAEADEQAHVFAWERVRRVIVEVLWKLVSQWVLQKGRLQFNQRVNHITDELAVICRHILHCNRVLHLAVLDGLCELRNGE